MLKRLALAFTLLLPFAVYAANPSIPFGIVAPQATVAPLAGIPLTFVATAGSGTPPPSSIVCDSGPNFTGQIPPQAIRAGYTRCALNADFTQPYYANKADFIDACGSTRVPRWYWNYFLSGTQLNCNDITVGADNNVTPNLPQVLHIAFQTSEWAGNPGAALQNGGNFNFPLQGYSLTLPCGAASTTPCFPVGIYVEVTMRTSSSSWTQDGTHFGHFYLNSTGAGIRPDGSQADPNNTFEWDCCETTGFGPSARPQMSDAFSGSVNGSFCCTVNGNPTFADLTQYHTYGNLITSNGALMGGCAFVDGVNQGANTTVGFIQNQCSTQAYQGSTSGAQFIQHDNVITIGFGGFSNTTPTNPLELWIQSVRVWECDDWQTQQCNIQNPITTWP